MDHRRFWFGSSSSSVGDRTTPNDTALLEILASYVPKLVVRRLYLSAVGIEVPEKENYYACVVFADVSGFTALTEKMTQMGLEGVERLTVELNRYFDKLIGVIYKYGGDIIKVG